MKKTASFIVSLALIVLSVNISAQKKNTGADLITVRELESHMAFLASPLLQGRANGEAGLEIAQQYLVSQLKELGLKPANGNSYLQPYQLTSTKTDTEKTVIQVIDGNGDTVTIRKPVFQLLPTGPAEYDVAGEVVFAGYGLKQDKYGYNDFRDLKADGKILLIMAGAPTSEDGKKYLFETVNWDSFMSIEVKLTALIFTRAKAVIIVMDPKSGLRSVDEKYPGISGQLATSMSLRGEQPRSFQMPGMPKVLFADRSVADEILKGTGKTLEDLQLTIDSSVSPNTFTIPGKQVRIREAVRKEDITLNNVAAIIEGSDPLLKNEYVIFSGHADHIGGSGDKVNPGADDNASGCAALLSIAKTFQSLPKKPLRSILFLWVSGEEIGLYGSQSFVNDPLVPLENTVCDLNIDMIGRIKGPADTVKSKPVVDPGRVFVITGYQSRELLSIAEEVDMETVLDLDYSLSTKNHPLQLFVRSDHYNFARKDIPVMFFTTGEHSDYHSPGDVLEKINFDNMTSITRAIYQIGYNVANRKTRIVVDNPMSKW
ncbi:MAG: M28 family peptidase [Bacteroidales bacterium]|jgi:hypothetical protein|nr:M28 family peptidase [Bacteroidales bacterium]